MSKTPVREALIQLVRERDMQAGKAITAPELSLAQYLELRSIRFHLEGTAADLARLRIIASTLDQIAETSARMASRRWAARP